MTKDFKKILLTMYRSFPNSFWSHEDLKKVASEEAIRALVNAHYLFEIKIEYADQGSVMVDGQRYKTKDGSDHGKQGLKNCYGLGPNALNIIYAHRLQVLTYWIIALTIITLLLTLSTNF